MFEGVKYNYVLAYANTGRMVQVLARLYRSILDQCSWDLDQFGISHFI